VRELSSRYQRERFELYKPADARLDFLPFLEEKPLPCRQRPRPVGETRTSVRVLVRASETRCDLVLREPFSSRWTARFGQTIVRSERAFGFANRFTIPKGWSGDVSIRFTASDLPVRGAVVTMLGLSALLLVAFERHRRRRPAIGILR
jgi:hypothetical protein